jgi:hypothetical protein
VVLADVVVEVELGTKSEVLAVVGVRDEVGVVEVVVVDGEGMAPIEKPEGGPKTREELTRLWRTTA